MVVYLLERGIITMRYFNINDISYVQVKNKEQKYLVCPKGENHCFDLFNTSYMSTYRDRIFHNSSVKYIDSFMNMLKNYDLDVLLINSDGEIEEKITENKVMHILDIYNKIQPLSDEQLLRIDEVAEEVANICANKVLKLDEIVENIMADVIEVNEESRRDALQIYNNVFITEYSFYDLLKKYIKIDLICNGLGIHSAIISKNDKFIDYKIIRLLKYLDLDVNMNGISNFKISYNYKEINCYDEKGNLVDNINFDSKVKKLVDKPIK